MSKQMRVSDAVFDEIKRLVEEYDVDRKSMMNTSVVIIKCILETNAQHIEFIDGDSTVRMPVPILFKRRKK